MKHRFSIIALAAWLLLSQPAYAWNHFGHMTVAWVCYEKLTPQVRQRANALLKLNPLYSDWAQQVSQSKEDKDEQIFMLAATWPDIIRKGHGYSNEDANSPECNLNIGYTDKNVHKSWHHVDYPYSQDHTPLPPLPTPNAQTQIAKFRLVLASHATDELKSYDLCWLLHLVGDVHQPLHCITRVTKSAPKGDDCGNDVKLTGTDEELHWFWDDALGPDGPPATVIPFAKTLEKANSKLAAKGDENDWIRESHKLAVEDVYQKPIGPDDGPYTVTDSYRQMASKLTRERAELAGERLANLLNEALK